MVKNFLEVSAILLGFHEIRQTTVFKSSKTETTAANFGAFILYRQSPGPSYTVRWKNLQKRMKLKIKKILINKSGFE